MYNYNYNDLENMLGGVSNQSSGAASWTIIAFILAIVGGILAYFLFVKQDKKLDNKFLVWLKNFLEFKEILIEPILKVTYIIFAIYITLTSFNLIGTSFVAFLATLLLGNVLLRVVYESLLMFVMIWKNTKEINSKLKK